MSTHKWTKISRGFYSLDGTPFAVAVDGFEQVAEHDRESDGVLAGITGREWAVIKYREGEEKTSDGGDNLDWFDTMREARAMAEREVERGQS